MKRYQKVIIAVMAIGMMFSGVNLTGTDAQAQANGVARNCVVLTNWRVNQSGDTNVRRGTATNPGTVNDGSIFLNATLFEHGNTLTTVQGFGWQRGLIGGPASQHNGWGGSTMWAVRTRFVRVSSATACPN